MNLKIIVGDITELGPETDCIVNSANESLLGGSGVDGAIHEAAGPLLEEECETLGGCLPGEAKYTKGYALPQKYIIHTVGPRYLINPEPAKTLQNAYLNSLILADQLGCKVIAFPSISTGVFRYPLKEAAEIAINTIKSYKPKNLEQAYMCIYQKDKTYFAYKKALEELE